MADAHLLEIQQGGQNLVEYSGCLAFAHRSIGDNLAKELTVAAVFHKNVNFVVFADHLVDLSDILV